MAEVLIERGCSGGGSGRGLDRNRKSSRITLRCEKLENDWNRGNEGDEMGYSRDVKISIHSILHLVLVKLSSS